jgi:hypothetical protein
MPDIRTVYLGADTALVLTSLTDQNLQQQQSPFEVPRAGALYVAVAYLTNGMPQSIAGFSSWQLALKEQGVADTPPLFTPIAPSSVTTLITQAQYDAGSAENVLFYIPGSLMNLTPGKNYTAWITAVDTASGETVLIGQADITLAEAGLEVTVSTGLYYTSTQSDQRYPIKRASGSATIPAGQAQTYVPCPGIQAPDEVILPARICAMLSSVVIAPDNGSGNGQFLVTLNGPVAVNTTFKWWDLAG